MIVPAPIKPGDKIRIVSPAGKLKAKRVLPAVEWLSDKGYRVEIGEHTFSKHFQFAGKDEDRLNDLQEALNDTECKAIICSRGGYGTVRIIDQLDFTEFKKHPKWLVGYSDVTALHLAANNLGVASIHGTMPPLFLNQNGEANESLKSLIQLITGEATSYEFDPTEANREGKASAELIGGNLSLLTSLIGSGFEPNTDDKILFIEDIGEYLYRIDRMMHQLKLAGKLDKLAGLVVGDFTDIYDNKEPFGLLVQEIISDAVKGYDYPVSFGLKAGHDEVNLALSFGQKWNLEVKEKSSILTLQQ